MLIATSSPFRTTWRTFAPGKTPLQTGNVSVFTGVFPTPRDAPREQEPGQAPVAEMGSIELDAQPTPYGVGLLSNERPVLQKGAVAVGFMPVTAELPQDLDIDMLKKK